MRNLAGQRTLAARRLTELLESRPGFTYLRLGDGELAYLLQCQKGDLTGINTHPATRSIEIAHCAPGIAADQATRLQAAYESCDYLDRHDHLAFNRANLPKLSLARAPGLFSNETPETAGILHDWSMLELPAYLVRHRVLFCGAEASLLRELLANTGYRELAARWWRDARCVECLQPAGGGAELSKHEQSIYKQLVDAVRTMKIDTVFLSLGGAAKYLGVQLARDCAVRVVDFGSMIRGLCYAGSAGHADWRASYIPFFFHVPYELHLGALERANPTASTAWLLNKAHCQLCLELMRKTPGQSIPVDAIDPSAFDPSPENLVRFKHALAIYRREHLPRAGQDPECRQLVHEFETWCWRKGLGWRGRLTRLLVRGKGLLLRR